LCSILATKRFGQYRPAHAGQSPAYDLAAERASGSPTVRRLVELA
jgi:hypothetical protein